MTCSDKENVAEVILCEFQSLYLKGLAASAFALTLPKSGLLEDNRPTMDDDPGAPANNQHQLLAAAALLTPGKTTKRKAYLSPAQVAELKNHEKYICCFKMLSFGVV